jgi:flagellin-like hook-associated protein FlgL
MKYSRGYILSDNANVCKVSQLGDLLTALSAYNSSTPISPISVDWSYGMLSFSRISPKNSQLAEEVKMALSEIDEARETLGTVQNRIEAVGEGLGEINE